MDVAVIVDGVVLTDILVTPFDGIDGLDAINFRCNVMIEGISRCEAGGLGVRLELTEGHAAQAHRHPFQDSIRRDLRVLFDANTSASLGE